MIRWHTVHVVGVLNPEADQGRGPGGGSKDKSGRVLEKIDEKNSPCECSSWICLCTLYANLHDHLIEFCVNSQQSQYIKDAHVTSYLIILP